MHIFYLGLTMCQDIAKCFINALLQNTQDVLLRCYYQHFTEKGIERMVKISRIRTWAKACTLIHHALLALMQCRSGVFDELFSRRVTSLPGQSQYWYTVFQLPEFAVDILPNVFLRPIFLYFYRQHLPKDTCFLIIFIQPPNFSLFLLN